MERLSYLLIASLFSCPVAAALDRMSADHSSGPKIPVFAVVGDVVTAGQMQFPASGQVTVYEAVMAAHPAAATVSVSVVHATTDRLTAPRVIERGRGDQSVDVDSQVGPNDVLVVTALSETDLQVVPNVGIYTSRGPVAAVIHQGQRLSDVAAALQADGIGVELSGAQVAAAQNRRTVYRSGNAQTALNHGDVVLSGRSVTRQPGRSGILNRSVSEWHSEQKTHVSPGNHRVTTAALQSDSEIRPGDFATTTSHQSAPSIPVPAVPAQFGASSYDSQHFSGLHIPESTSSASDAGVQSVVTSSSSDQTLSAASHGNRQLLAVTGGDNAGAIVTGLTASPSRSDAAISPDDQTAVIAAPLPPGADTTSAAASNEGGISGWNILFIAGMMAAGLLILFGWARSQRDADSVEPGTAMVATSGIDSLSAVQTTGINQQRQPIEAFATVTPPPGLARHALPSSPPTFATISARSISNLPELSATSEENVPPVNSEKSMSGKLAETTASHDSSISEHRLVADQEWFTGTEDWQLRRQPMVQPSQQTASVPEVMQPATEAAAMGSIAEASGRAGAATGTVISDQLIADLMARTGRDHAACGSTDARDVATVTSTDICGRDVTEQGSPNRPEVAVDILDQLVRNRLPVDLQQARLPMRISLYGRPSGPARLRIDAAHKQIPAPHFSATPDREASSGRRQQPAAPSGSGETDAGRTPSGLDRALNFLNERTDS